MQEIILDGLIMQEAPQDYIAEVFGFPEYYGKNLDALHDMLTEISEDTEVYLLHWESMGAYGKKLLRVFEDAAQENEKLKVSCFE
ncbi:MAG: barstar family protein [Firmicutes bacterium]|nr:barstar family protein [Bacillota bacterium]